MTDRPLRLDDLLALCRAYVPRKSRHGASYTRHSKGQWWPAHELGHLLTVPREAIGLPLFGMNTDVPYSDPSFAVQAAYELAAMSVSRRLLTTVGRPDLFEIESEGSDYEVMHYGSYRRAKTILRKTRTLRIPRTVRALERRLERTVAP